METSLKNACQVSRDPFSEGEILSFWPKMFGMLQERLRATGQLISIDISIDNVHKKKSVP